MLLNEKTLSTYGYDFDSISEKSSKLLIVTCDYCGLEFNVSKKNRHINHLVISKDACTKCKYIKMKEINLLKYGVDSVSKLDSVKEKIKTTNIDRYGGVAPACSKDVIKKAQKTNLRKYGATSYLGSEEGQENLKRVSLERYGVENPSSAEEVKEKRKETCRGKFGKDTYLGSEACKDATIEKLGVDNVFKLPEYQKLARNSKIENGSTDTYLGKTVSEWAEINGFSVRNFSRIVHKDGWEVAINTKRTGTRCEEKIKQFLDDLNIDYKFTKGVAGLVPDFQIGNLIIECDSYFFHSDYHNKDENYHFNKLKTYNEAGFKCLFFTEYEINHKWDIVKYLILLECGKVDEYLNHNLICKIIDTETANDFFSNNHIMGCLEDIPSINYAVCDGDKIYYVVSIKNQEILRFGSRRGYNLNGMTKVLEQLKGKSLFAYIDLRYGHGNLEGLGFVHEGTNKSFKWTNGTRVFNHMQFHSNTGYDKGLFKIWDCGQAKWRINV